MVTSRTATPRKAPRQARSKATVEAILQATAQVLVEDGYEGATTNRIAQRAGVSIGSLYQYFPRKEALVTALVEQHSAEVMALLSRMIVEDGAAPLEVVVPAFIRAMIRVHAVDPVLHRVLTEQLPRLQGFEGVREINVRGCALVRGYLEQHKDRLRDVDLDLAVFLLVTSVEAMTHNVVLERPELLNDDRVADEISLLVLRYLRPGPGVPG